MPVTSRARRALAILTASAALVAGSLVAATSASAADEPPLPTVMAATGDSITAGSMTCSILYFCPANSWSTGTSSTVQSHAARLRSEGASLRTYNDAVPGAVAADLPDQAAKAASQGAQYVTVLIGANDACSDSVSEMTSLDSFTASVTAALQTLEDSPADPVILVASIPNLTRLWELNKSNWRARLAWASLGFCDSMLANPTSTKTADVERRAAVQQRVDEFNAVLRTACAETDNCVWDGYAVASYEFTRSDISTRDYFHPSVSGQAALASLTWASAPWS